MSQTFGHEILDEIPERIFRLAEKALTSANTQATYYGPGIEHWPTVAAISACHAGELFLKAAIAKRHPLLLFKNVFDFRPDELAELSLEQLISRGRTHDFEKLPKIYWATTGNSIECDEVFEDIRKLRNSIQHFIEPDGVEFGRITLRFLYEIVDPLILKEFGVFAIDYTEQIDDGYDYLVGLLVREEIRFSIPASFHVGEVDLSAYLPQASDNYRNWFEKQLLSSTGSCFSDHMKKATWFHKTAQK